MLVVDDDVVRERLDLRDDARRMRELEHARRDSYKVFHFSAALLRTLLMIWYTRCLLTPYLRARSGVFMPLNSW